MCLINTCNSNNKFGLIKVNLFFANLKCEMGFTCFFCFCTVPSPMGLTSLFFFRLSCFIVTTMDQPPWCWQRDAASTRTLSVCWRDWRSRRWKASTEDPTPNWKPCRWLTARGNGELCAEVKIILCYDDFPSVGFQKVCVRNQQRRKNGKQRFRGCSDGTSSLLKTWRINENISSVRNSRVRVDMTVRCSHFVFPVCLSQCHGESLSPEPQPAEQWGCPI